VFACYQESLTSFELARLLLENYPSQRAEAMGHLDEAIVEFEAMSMKPALDTANALRVHARREAMPRNVADLSERQMQVLRLLASGKTTREIADELVLSERTVERHISDVYAKIGARNRAEAIVFALSIAPE